MNCRYAAKRHVLKIKKLLLIKLSNSVIRKIVLNTKAALSTHLFTIGSGTGLSRALWIAISAVLKTSVSKHTMRNFGCVVIHVTPTGTEKNGMITESLSKRVS